MKHMIITYLYCNNVNIIIVSCKLIKCICQYLDFGLPSATQNIQVNRDVGEGMQKIQRHDQVFLYVSFI